MDPYYQDDFVTLYCADALNNTEFVRDVDVVITSPPYNVHVDGKHGRGEMTILNDGYDTHDDAMPHDEYRSWQHACLRMMWNTLNEDGAIYYNHKPLLRGERARLPFDLIPDELPLRQVITWDRGSGFNSNLTAYLPTYEWIMLIAKPSYRLTERDSDVWRFPHVRPNEVAHPAPFPIGLPTRVIRTSGAKRVFDPFAGSGTTLVAAKWCGVEAVGVEISEQYCEIAVKRLAQESLSFGA